MSHQSGRPWSVLDVAAFMRPGGTWTLFIVVHAISVLLTCAAFAQGGSGRSTPASPPVVDEAPAALRQAVPVVAVASDQEIANRLAGILRATGWFENPRVEVRDGVVFLDGSTNLQDYRRWAGELAANTQGSVAVVNRVEVEADVGTTFGRAGEELARLGRQAMQTWPLVLLAMLIIVVAGVVSRLVGAVARWFFADRISSPLLLAVVVRIFAIPVFLLGVYFVLQVAGLTRLALTVLGGTGLIGIIIGFAFRDIAENFLASLLLSVRNPFRGGDLIEVAGHTGIVQNLNTRSTVLLTLDGNHVQIPNAMVFKSTIKNYSSSPNRRADFVIGIGYDSPIAKAQSLINGVLQKHPAVLREPEPLVLVNALSAATVDLKVFYWFDSATYSPDKINSALLRLCKNSLLQGGIELPDAAREVVFPKGVPIVRARAGEASGAAVTTDVPRAVPDDVEFATAGEDGLSSERPVVSPGSAVPEATENLLKP